MLLISKHSRKIVPDEKFGRKIGLMALLFGCWHKNLSRPFTIEHQSYCVCLSCGSRKHFDPVSMKTYGAFYFPPEISHKE